MFIYTKLCKVFPGNHLLTEKFKFIQLMRRHKTPALNPCFSLGVESISCHLKSQANILVTELYCHQGKKEGGATIAIFSSFVAKPPSVSTPISKISFLLSKDVSNLSISLPESPQ